MSEASVLVQLYPDIGVASMLKNQWGPDVAFQIAAVNDREPVAEDDELVVLAAPDPQSAQFLSAFGSARGIVGLLLGVDGVLQASGCSTLR